MCIEGTARTVAQIRAETATPRRHMRRQWLLRLWVVLMRTAPPVGPVRGLIAQGDAEERPFDASSLAETLEMPRSTVNWAVQQLVKTGQVRRERDGRRIALYLTDHGWRQFDRTWRAVDPLLDEFLELSNTPDRR